MEHFSKYIVSAHSLKFTHGIKLRSKKLQAWDNMADDICNDLTLLASESNKKILFEHIHVVDSRTRHGNKNKLGHIQVSWGQHPLEYHDYNSETSTSEGGCTMVLSQTILGDVVCMFWPFSSEFSSMPEQHLIYRIYPAPWSITSIEIEKLSEILFSYAQVSSVYGNPDFCDHRRVLWLRISDIWINLKLSTLFIKLFGEITSLAIKAAITGMPKP